jgi:hypothetical protein
MGKMKIEKNKHHVLCHHQIKQSRKFLLLRKKEINYVKRVLGKFLKQKKEIKETRYEGKKIFQAFLNHLNLK